MNQGIAGAFAFVVLCGCVLPGAAEAQKSTGNLSTAQLSTAQLLTLVRESESVKSKSDLNLLGTGPGVTVLTTPHRGASKRDLQIEAIFVARALIEGAPGQVETVKVIFAGAEEGLVANVNKDMIVDYGSGKVSAEKLLAAVRLTSVQPEATPNVVPGPQQERRLLIWQRIDKLSHQGTGVQPFKALFDSAEEVAATGDRSALSAKLEDLELKLSEQEEQVALARKVAQGKGVMSPPKRVNPGSSASTALVKTTNSEARLPKNLHPGVGGTAMEQSLADRSGSSNFGLKRLYANRQLLLNTLSRKGDPNLARVTELFSSAEEKLKSGKEAEALTQLSEIKSIVDRSSRSDRSDSSFNSPNSRPFSRGPNFQRARRDRFSI